MRYHPHLPDTMVQESNNLRLNSKSFNSTTQKTPSNLKKQMALINVILRWMSNDATVKNVYQKVLMG